MIIKQKQILSTRPAESIATTKKQFKTSYVINDYDNYLNFDFKPVYNREKCYNTEIIVITNSTRINDVNLWLDWHLNVIKFNHIIFIDNNDSDYLRNTCSKFQNVEYIHRPGILNQSSIYTEYVNKSNAQWVLPIDDDEYLYISDNFDNNINYYLTHLLNIKPKYKYAFNWHMMFANEMKDVRFGNNLFAEFPYEYIGKTYTYYDHLNLFKTIVNTDIKHFYVNENNKSQTLPGNAVNNDFDPNFSDVETDFLGLIHNPISKVDLYFFHAYSPEHNISYPGIFNNNIVNPNCDAYLMHFKYTTLNEWNQKIAKFKFTNISDQYKCACYNKYKFIRTYQALNKNLLQYNNKILKLYDNKAKKL